MADEANGKAREIEEAATKLFARRGFDGVSVRDICSAVGANCSTVSYYFGGKKGLYLKVLRSQFAIYEDVIDNLLSKNLSPDDELLALIKSAREIHVQCPYFSAITAREGCYPSAEFAQALTEHEAKYGGGHILRLISGGQRQGVFRSRLNPLYVSRILSLLLNSQTIARSLTEILHPDFSFVDTEYYENVRAILLDGLLTAPEKDESQPVRHTGKQSAAPAGGRGRGLD